MTRQYIHRIRETVIRSGHLHQHIQSTVDTCSWLRLLFLSLARQMHPQASEYSVGGTWRNDHAFTPFPRSTFDGLESDIDSVWRFLDQFPHKATTPHSSTSSSLRSSTLALFFSSTTRKHDGTAMLAMCCL